MEVSHAATHNRPALALVLGALLTILPGLWNQFAASRSAPLAPRLSRRLSPSPRLRVFLRRWAKALAYDQQGGYVHDTAMSQYIPAQIWGYTVGTWAFTITSNVGSMVKAAAANVSVIHIPLAIPQNSIAQKGGYLKSIDIWYKIATAACNAVTPVVTRTVLPADNTAMPAVIAPAFTYDGGHDTAAKRYASQSHKMTLTITTPFWLDDDDEVYVELTVDAAATSAVTAWGARANFTLRV